MKLLATVICPDCLAEMPAADIREHLRHRCKAKRGRYRVAAREKRTYNGVTYASAIEMKRAKELDVLRNACEIAEWFRQVRIPIGCEEIVVDFLVVGDKETWAEEVKGHVTADWARHLRWWKEYGRVRLVILKAARVGGWEREVVTP